MRLSQALIITSKDFSTFRKKRNIIYSTFIMPVIVSVAFPLLVRYILTRKAGAVGSAEMLILLPAFTFFFVILAGVIPSTISSYSIVGEKIENSLEPLLATPTTDGEILLGKGIAAFVPPLATILASGAIFMGLLDVFTVKSLGFYYFPNWGAAAVFALMVPLTLVMGVEWNVLVSSRVSDVRIAQQVGFLAVVPLGGIYVSGELNIISLGDVNTLLMVSAAMAVVDVVLFYLARTTFRRERILTKWK